MTNKRIAIKKKGIVKLDNSLPIGTVFYGLHMSEGLAQYDDLNVTVLLKNETIKRMNPTFAGKPLVVGHIDKYSPISEMDGVVAESFYNPIDGKHWSKFIVTTQKGLEAIKKGWVLSNSLVVKRTSRGGDWHGLSFDKTVEEGEFHHMAIVPNPRYGESVIYTPEQYKQYNKEKQLELEMLSNSKENPMKFRLFKNEAQDEKKMKELMAMSVVLPTTKRTVTIEQLCNEADEKKEESEEAEIDMDGVKKKISEFIKEFKDLQKQYSDLKAEFDSLEIIGEESSEEVLENVEEDEEQLSNSDDSEEEDEDLDDSGDLEEDEEDLGELDEEALDALDAAEAEEEKKLQNSKKPVVTEKKQAVKKGSNIKKLKNAQEKVIKLANSQPQKVLSLSSDMIAEGARRYGSNKKK